MQRKEYAIRAFEKLKADRKMNLRIVESFRNGIPDVSTISNYFEKLLLWIVTLVPGQLTTLLGDNTDSANVLTDSINGRARGIASEQTQRAEPTAALEEVLRLPAMSQSNTNFPNRAPTAVPHSKKWRSTALQHVQ